MKSVIFTMFAVLIISSLPSYAGKWVYGNYTSIWGTRNYQTWIPSGYDPTQPSAMVVALHGCAQNPSQYAGLSRFNELAERENVIVLYPNQATYANPTQCWNWMLSRNQSRDTGEVSIIMGMVKRIKSQYTVDHSRVYVHGVSGGAAMTSVLLSCHPDTFSAGASIAGSMYKSATTISGGAYVLLNGSIYSPEKRGYSAWACAGKPQGLRPRVLVMHGSDDILVHPKNAGQTIRQFIQLNDYTDDGIDNNSVSTNNKITTSGVSDGGMSYVIENYYDGSDIIAQSYTLLGMSHAYPGGDNRYLFAAPSGPDATEIMWEFFDGKKPEPTPVITPVPTATPTPTPMPTPTPPPTCEEVKSYNYYHKKAGRASSRGNWWAPSYSAKGSGDSMPGSTWGINTLHSTQPGFWSTGGCP